MMCFKSVIRFIILCLCLDFSHQRHIRYFKTLKFTTDNNWDYIIFTQSWPTTVCKDWTDDNTNNQSCIFPRGNIWTIHGLWPQRIDNLYPVSCNSSWLFDSEQLEPIEKELNFRWKNVKRGTDKHELWAHEWHKHGTCAASIEPLDTQFKYFNKCLELNKQYSIDNILQNADILPSNNKPVTVEEINKAVVSKIGTKVRIQCRFENENQYLYEIRICFNKQLNPIDCDMFAKYGDDNTFTNCDESVKIIYPEKPIV